MQEAPPHAASPAAEAVGPAVHPGAQPAIFVAGSTMRHVVVMTATGSIGLMAVFVVDLLSLFYVSRLGDPTLTAGVGFATVILYLAVSINVGTMIAATALVSRALGAGEAGEARGLAASVSLIAGLVGLVVSLILLPLLTPVLTLIGATGEALEVARRFLWIALPSNALMAVGMAFSGILRAVGDANRAMWVTLGGGLVTAALDPLLIFGAGLGTDGAALAIVASRFVYLTIGWHGLHRVHDLIGDPRGRMARDLRPTAGVAAPAILTNVATPIASALVTGVLARYGDQAVAAAAIIDRLTPVAFGALFALSGAIGPILGQNYGALRFDRMRQALKDAFVFALAYVIVVWILLVLARNGLVSLFAAEGQTASLVVFFCLVSGAMWLFIGALFVANAAFNNLGFALYSTGFNWGRATLGTVPFAMAGAAWGGPNGVLIGVALGAVGFGVAAMWTSFRVIDRLEARAVAAAGSPA